MKAVGVCVRVEESQLHAVTALSGSGPAYLFYLMEAMIEAARSLGLSEQEGAVALRGNGRRRSGFNGGMPI